MTHEDRTPRCVVVGGVPGDVGWQPFLSDVAALSGATLVRAAVGAGDHLDQQEILARAAQTHDPVLILPTRRHPAEGTASGDAHLRRMLVPIDRSLSERRILRRWIRRAQELGIEIRQVHVLGPAAVPAMWEGPGHGAASWRQELQLRHQAGRSKIRVEAGDPAAAIAAATDDVDLVVVCWKGNAAADRAQVARQVLAAGQRPVLLVR